MDTITVTLLLPLPMIVLALASLLLNLLQRQCCWLMEHDAQAQDGEGLVMPWGRHREHIAFMRDIVA